MTERGVLGFPRPLGLTPAKIRRERRRVPRIRKPSVDEDRAKKEAFDMGYKRGKEAGKHAYHIPEVQDSGEAYNNIREHFPQSAKYANFILPDLRELAGFEDPMDVGTYTEPPDEEAHFLYNELVDEFWEGVSEGIEDGWTEAERG